MLRGNKCRIYPNKEQEVLLNKHFGCSRFVYNYFLNERKEQYQNNKKSDNYYAQAKTPIFHQAGLRQIDSCVILICFRINIYLHPISIR